MNETVPRGPRTGQRQMITFLKRYSPKFGVREANSMSAAQARANFETGEPVTILFGDPDTPNRAIIVFKGDEAVKRRIDVLAIQDGVVKRRYVMNADQERGFDGLLISEYASDIADANDRIAHFFIADVFVDGDLPTLEFGREVYYAISVP